MQFQFKNDFPMRVVSVYTLESTTIKYSRTLKIANINIWTW